MNSRRFQIFVSWLMGVPVARMGRAAMVAES
jgi:hypothetical protein